MPDYGATIAGVKALLPSRVIGDDTAPSNANLVSWIGEISDRVTGVIGEIEESSRFWAAARAVVHIGVAATYWDAAFPEHSGVDGRYGTVLWERFEKELARLQKAMGDDPDTADPTDPSYCFPDPMFIRAQGF